MKKLTSIFLIILLLFSNIGFTTVTHFCGGKAVDSKFTILSRELSCGMSEMDNTSNTIQNNCPNENHNFSNAPCCQNETKTLHCDDNLPSIDFIKLDFGVDNALVSFNHVDHIETQAEIIFKPKNPPPRLKIRPYVLFQSFLI